VAERRERVGLRVTPNHKLRALGPLAAIILVAFVVRVIQLGYVNFHSDEAHFFRIAYEGTLLQATAYDDPHPPLFLAMLQGWIGLAGISQVGVRMLPILYGTLFVPVVYQLGKQLGSGRLGLAAAFVVAANPAFIFYSKEVRNNGLLAFTGALSFVLLLMALRRLRLLPAYVVSALAALYSHYYDIPVVGLELLVGLAWLWRNGKLRVWPWAAAPVAIAAGFLPWMLYARSTIANYNAGQGSLGQVWRVLIETYAALNLGFAIRPGDIFWLGLAMGGLILIGLAGLAAMRRELPLLVLAYAFLPVLFGALTLLRQTNFNPRYLFAGAPAYALVVGAALVLLWRLHWAAGGVAAAFLLGITGLTVHNTDFTPEFQPNGYRELAAYLSRHAGPSSDSVVLDGTSQWPLYFYYGRLQEHLPQPVEFLPRDTLPETQDVVRQLLARGGVWYLESDVDRYDPHHDVERLLAADGYQALDLHFAGQRAEYFAGSPVGPLSPRSETAGPLRLIAATRLAGGAASASNPPPVAQAADGQAPTAKPAIAAGGPASAPEPTIAAGQVSGTEPAIAAGQVAGIELDWQRGDQAVVPFKLSLRLVDAGGAIAVQNDTLPLGGYADFAGWQPGQTLRDRAGLLVPVGTIPGSYELQALAYDAASGRALGPAISLGRLTVDHSAPERADAAELPAIGASIGPLRLDAASVPSGGLTPGDRVDLTLLWSGGPTPAAQYAVVAAGSARERVLVGSERYPTTAWQPNDVVRQTVSLRLPASTRPGAYTISVEGVPIGQVRVLPVERSFAVPPLAHPVNAQFGQVAELLGYDAQVDSAAVHLRLVWRCIGETDTSYTAFVHLLGPDGHVLSQVDAPPGTDRWVPGQVMTTTYDLAVPAADSKGRLEVGLYDQPTGKRLPTSTGADSVILSAI